MMDLPQLGHASIPHQPRICIDVLLQVNQLLLQNPHGLVQKIIQIKVP